MHKIIMKKINLKVLFFSFLAVIAVSVLGSSFTNADSDWYNSVRPAITPPNWVFPVVWTTLYIMIALSIYFAFTNAKKSQKKTLYFLFGANLIFNLLWSWLFFGLHLPILSMADIILMWITIISLIFYNYRISKLSSWLLVPYFLWVSFASILNGLIAFT